MRPYGNIAIGLERRLSVWPQGASTVQPRRRVLQKAGRRTHSSVGPKKEPGVRLPPPEGALEGLFEGVPTHAPQKKDLPLEAANLGLQLRLAGLRRTWN